jgi:hypothetical protein
MRRAACDGDNVVAAANEAVRDETSFSSPSVVSTSAS